MNTKSLHKIGYGMYIIGSVDGDRRNGQTANTIFQITSEPPTVAVSINKQNLTHDFIRKSGVFTAAILHQNTPLPYIGHFGFKSGKDTDKLEGVNYRLGTTGAPIFTDHANAYLEAKVSNSIDAGTHTIFIGEVVDGDVLNEEASMTYEYYHQVKRGTTPKTAPSYINEKKGDA